MLIKNITTGYILLGNLWLKKQTKATYVGIKNNKNIKTMLLSVVFIMCIPNMLSAGKNMGIIKNAFSDVLRLRFGRENISFLFILYPTITNIMNTISNEIRREIIDNGVK